MVNLVGKIIKLMIGLFTFSLGILLTIHANLGTAPWDTFHLGVVRHTSLSLGRVSQVVGLFIIILCIYLRQKLGVGTVANIYFVGFFLDLIQRSNYLPSFDFFWSQLAMLLTGIFVMGWGTVIYLDVGWGSGPRDGLMLGLSQRFSIQLWQARTIVEVTILFFGYLLGGKVGLGTVLTALLAGPAVQLASFLFNFIPTRLFPKAVQEQ